MAVPACISISVWVRLNHACVADLNRDTLRRLGQRPCQIEMSWSFLAAANARTALKSAFERRHEALYTYSFPDQDPVLVNARAATVGQLPELVDETLPAREAPAAPRT